MMAKSFPLGEIAKSGLSNFPKPQLKAGGSKKKKGTKSKKLGVRGL